MPRAKYRGFPKHPAECAPFEGSTTAIHISEVVVSRKYLSATSAERLALLRGILRDHDNDRDLHEVVARMTERYHVPLLERLRRRWREYVHHYDRYTCYGEPREVIPYFDR